MHATRLAALLLLVPAPIAAAQTIDDVLPRVGDPGDVVRLVGTNLGGTSRVRFTATVGGFTGQLSKLVAPISVSATEVVAQVPTFNAFSPPDASPPGLLVGTVAAITDLGDSNPFAFGFLEATFGAVTTEGQGGSEPAGLEPRIGFDLAGGVPEAGNLAFRPEVTGALPNAIPILAIGAQLPLPYPVIAGGDLVIDPFLPVTYVFGVPTVPQPTDEYEALVPIPPGVPNITAVLQWVTIDPLTFAASISNALVVEL